jgi:hypothetical protein
VTFYDPLIEEVKEASFDHCTLMAEQPDDTDWVHNLEHRERLTIGFWGSMRSTMNGKLVRKNWLELLKWK